ncbi:MAG TPA: hypothetical protein VF210_12075 [Pseudomonadales bacterium]
MSRKSLQRIALGYCILVLAVAIWFWSRQVQSVIDLLRLAYG